MSGSQRGQCVERRCVACDRTFRDVHRICPACRSTDRVCVTCGEAFRGNQRECPACRLPDRICSSCGKAFRGTNLKCTRCQAETRVCLTCGGMFYGTRNTCPPCCKAAADRDLWLASERARTNARRARKRQARIAGPVPAAIYAQVLASGPCVYCGSGPNTVDHVRPLSRGGAEHETNLVPSCHRCNYSKRDRLLIEWQPDKVAYAVQRSPAVAAELARLTEENHGNGGTQGTTEVARVSAVGAGREAQAQGDSGGLD